MEPALSFESRFESGNLLSAARTGLRSYVLHLSTDYNTNGHTQWFYFSVSRPALVARGAGGGGGACGEVGGSGCGGGGWGEVGESQTEGGQGRAGDSGAEAEEEGLDEFEFQIVNMNKSDSLYNYGLLPLVCSQVLFVVVFHLFSTGFSDVFFSVFEREGESEREEGEGGGRERARQSESQRQ